MQNRRASRTRLQLTRLLGSSALLALSVGAQAQPTAAPQADGPQGVNVDANAAAETARPAAAAPMDPTNALGTENASSADSAAAPPIEVTVEQRPAERKAQRSADAVTVLDTTAAQRESGDLGSVIDRSEGVHVRRSGGLGSSARLAMNGFTDDQVRVFLDGIPLALAGFPLGLPSVPLGPVEEIALYRGIVPIALGSDALGGAVDLQTYGALTARNRLAFSYQVGSFDTHRLSAGLTRVHRPLGVFGQIDLFLDRARNDYPMTVDVPGSDGRVSPRTIYRRNDHYRGQGVIATLGVQRKPWARRLALRAHFNTYEKGIPHNLLAKVPYGRARSQARSRGLQLEHIVNFAPLQLRSKVGVLLRTLRLEDTSPCSYDWFGECRRLTEPGEIGARPVEQHVEQPTLFTRLQGTVHLFSEQQLELSVAPTHISRTGEDRALQRLGQRDPLDGRRRIFSLVTAARYRASVLEDRLRMQLFGKYYGFFAQAEQLLPAGGFAPGKQSVHRGGGGATLRAEFIDELLLAKLAYEFATRLPGPDEMFGDSVLTESNLALAPERSHNANLSLVGTTESERLGSLSYDVTGFVRMADALIIRIIGVDTARYENIGTARVLGLQSHVLWNAPDGWLAAGAQLTYQDLRNTSDSGPFANTEGDRLPNRPYLFGALSLTTRIRNLIAAGDELLLSARARFVAEYFFGWESGAAGTNKPAIPAQEVLNLVLQHRTHLSERELSTTIEVHNLTDAVVYDNLNVQLPGRALYAKVALSL